MRHSLPEVLPDFSNAKILVIGDIMLDRYWFGTTARLSPEAPVPIVNINNIDNRPGGAGNVALNIAALGAQVTLLGIVGNDEAGNVLEEQLSASGVKIVLTKLDSVSTIIKLRIISRHQQLLRLDFEEQLITGGEEKLIANYKEQLDNTKLVILSDYNKGTLPNPQLLIHLAHKANIPVLVDPKNDDFSLYQHADMITPNLKEFETVAGKCSHEQELLEKGLQLLTDYQIKSLLITRGENGMTLIEEHDTTHFPASAREVLDITGAGDTVISMLGTALAAGLTLPNATALANVAASLVVGKLGAATVTPPELQVALTGKTNFVTGIINEEQLLKAIQEARAQNKKVVFTNGCFDILHAGHVTYLQMAKELGDFLIVAVNADESIRKSKGANRPINHLEHRMTVLAGLGVVDWVVPFADDTPERLLRLLKPDLLVKGGDYELEQVVGANIVRAYGGEVRTMNVKVESSSTSIINKIIKGIKNPTDETQTHG